MFDIGFWEIMIIGLVALLVVGPERLPGLAYTAGKWLGKGRAMIRSIKAEIDREMQADELKRIVEEQKKLVNPLEEIIEETGDVLGESKAKAQDAVKELEDSGADESSK